MFEYESENSYKLQRYFEQELFKIICFLKAKFLIIEFSKPLKLRKTSHRFFILSVAVSNKSSSLAGLLFIPYFIHT